MPVWLAIGGVVVGAIIGGDSHSDYSDHSDHSDYGDYSNYSDAAERRQRRLNAARNEYESAKQTLIDIKNNQLQKYLSGTPMGNISDSSVENVSVNSVQAAGNEKIKKDCDNEIKSETAELEKQISDIDYALNRLNNIRSQLKKEYGLDDSNSD